MKAGRLLSFTLMTCIVTTTVMTAAAMSAEPDGERIRGTLVVAVPVQEGLVACADKRLYNVDSDTYRDDGVKIRKVSDNVLFVATNTIGFYDRRKKQIVFDAFELAANYTSRNRFSDSREFWDGLKTEIRNKLLEYVAARNYSELPETDKANNNLLFNLIFYSVAGGRARSHTLQVFYEKKRTPVVSVIGPVSEEVRSPKLSGKGRDLMLYIARHASLASDPAILKFDEARFDVKQISINEAVEFSRKLFRLTSTGVPKAQVSSSFDCALLSYQQGFRWIEGGAAGSSSSARMTPSIR